MFSVNAHFPPYSSGINVINVFNVLLKWVFKAANNTCVTL